MNDIQKRFLLFLLGCILTRASLVYFATLPNLLPVLAIMALVISIGFFTIWFYDLRKVGDETMGDEIWWNHLRPIHSLLYFITAVLAFVKSKKTWIPLAFDLGIGLTSFLNYHWKQNNFKKLI
jgi:hypothetical protein